MNEEPGINVTANYVYRELQRHEAECSKRWMAVLATAVVNLVVLVGGMATIIVNLLERTH